MDRLPSVNPSTLQVVALSGSAERGGTERVLLDLARDAKKHAVELRVVVPRSGPLLEDLDECETAHAVVPAPRGLLGASQREGHLFRAPFALKGLLAWSGALRAHAYVHQADLIYSLGFKTHAATVVGRLKPAVWHLHEFPPRTTGAVWRAATRIWPDGLVANSRAVANAWHIGSHPTRVDEVVPNGVDTDVFRPREPTGWIHDQLNIPRTAKLIGMPAIFARWKGQLGVVQAFAQAQDRMPDVHLVLAGGSIYDTIAEQSYQPELRRSVADAGPNVHLLPFQRDMHLVYPELALTIHNSVRPEPFGRVIIESMACGVPVIAADAGGPTEIISPASPPDQISWLVTPNSTRLLGDQMADSISNPGLKSIGAAARLHVERHYSARLFASGLCDYFWRISGDRRNRKGPNT